MAATVLKLVIPAGTAPVYSACLGKATPSPPIGPAFGQRGLKAHDFCKAFNDRSKLYIPGTPLRCHIHILADKSYTFAVRPPCTSHLLKRAAGIAKASTERVVANMSAKVLYEVAKVKHADPELQHASLKRVFGMLLASARSYGFKITC